MRQQTREQNKDIRLIGRFVEVYCIGRHNISQRSDYWLPGDLGRLSLCQECAGFLGYAVNRRLNCPIEAEKPSCKRCRIHCYAPRQRAQVREIMSYAGKRMILRGRLDYLWHYLF